MAVGVRGVNGKLRRYLDSLGLGPAALAPALFGGAMAGLYVTVASLSYPALIFTGELQVHQATGIGMALVGSLILAAVVALTGSPPAGAAGHRHAGDQPRHVGQHRAAEPERQRA